MVLHWPRARFLLVLAVAVALLGGWIVAGPDREAAPSTNVPSGRGPSGSLGAGLSGCLERGAGSSGAGRNGGSASSLDEVRRDVERIRRLRFRRAPRVTLLSKPALRARVGELSRDQATPSEGAREQRALEALGAIPPGTDLVTVERQALKGQIIGLYDPESRTLLVGASGRLGTLERITLAHELEHALADQRLGIPVAERPKQRAADSLEARRDLVEGDATLTMLDYALRSIPLTELLRLATDPEVVAEGRAGLKGLSPYLRRELLSPYTDGLAFDCHLYENGGWRAVDWAYRNPPKTTYEILFPDRYPSPAAKPPPPGTLAAPWRRAGRAPLGAAPLLFLFEAPGGEASRALPNARGFVSTWHGGEIDLWTAGPGTAVGISLLDRSPGGRLCAGVAGWYSLAFPDSRPASRRRGERLALRGSRQDAVLRCRCDQVRLGIAPNLADARRLAHSI